MEVDKKGPALKFPPPLLAVTAVATGYLLDWRWPLPVADTEYRWIGGLVLIVCAALLAFGALWQFFRAKTHIEPWHPTTTVIRHGLYAYSRNPIYLAFCIATAGTGLVLDSWWILLSVAPLAAALQSLVIRREEAYLEGKFGQDYIDYTGRVRRWI